MTPTDIDTITDTKLFTICSLVTNKDEYKQMVASFYAAGFTEDVAEFLYADNSNQNKYDGFTGIKSFLTKATEIGRAHV